MNRKKDNLIHRIFSKKKNLIPFLITIILCSSFVSSYYFFQPLFMKHITDEGLLQKNAHRIFYWCILWCLYGLCVSAIKIIQTSLSLRLQNKIKSHFPYSDPIIYSVRKNKWGVNLFVTDRDIHYQKKLFCNWSPKDNNIYLPGNSFATPFVAAQLVYLRKNGIATNELTSFFPTAPSINPTSFIG